MKLGGSHLEGELLVGERRHDVADRRLAFASNREHLVERGPRREYRNPLELHKARGFSSLFRELPVVVAHLDDPSAARRHQIVGSAKSHDVGVVAESACPQHGGGTLGDTALS